MSKEFELIVRAFISKNGKILVCKTNGRDYYFLPGGHVEFGETMRDALIRELREELDVMATSVKFIGGIENLFIQDGEKKHEVTFIFHTEIDMEDVASNESHIKFSWLANEEFINSNIVPPAIKDAVIAWTAEKEPFFIEEGTDK